MLNGCLLPGLHQMQLSGKDIHCLLNYVNFIKLVNLIGIVIVNSRLLNTSFISMDL